MSYPARAEGLVNSTNKFSGATSVNSDHPQSDGSHPSLSPRCRTQNDILLLSPSSVVSFGLMLLTSRHFMSLLSNASMLGFPIHRCTKYARTMVAVQPVRTRTATHLPSTKTSTFGVAADPVPGYLLVLRYPFIRFPDSFWLWVRTCCIYSTSTPSSASHSHDEDAFRHTHNT